MSYAISKIVKANTTINNIFYLQSSVDNAAFVWDSIFLHAFYVLVPFFSVCVDGFNKSAI